MVESLIGDVRRQSSQLSRLLSFCVSDPRPTVACVSQTPRIYVNATVTALDRSDRGWLEPSRRTSNAGLVEVDPCGRMNAV